FDISWSFSPFRAAVRDFAILPRCIEPRQENALIGDCLWLAGIAGVGWGLRCCAGVGPVMLDAATWKSEPASLGRSCPRSFRSARVARFGLDDGLGVRVARFGQDDGLGGRVARFGLDDEPRGDSPVL